MRRPRDGVAFPLLLGAFLAALAVARPAAAQPPSPGAPASPRAAAPIDLTGQWVAIVNEDWRWRMVTPAPGDYASVQPLNARGREVADGWDPSQDGSCKAYGAAGLMRMPLRLRIDWDGDALELVTDAGQQTRRFEFGAPDTPVPASTAPSLQGRSVARWHRPRGAGSPFGPGGAAAGGAQSGSLEVSTTNLAPGWLRRNGVPYSAETRLTEYFDRFAAPDASEWLVVTTVVEDPVYLNGPFVTSSHFRRETDTRGWNPRPCRAGP